MKKNRQSHRVGEKAPTNLYRVGVAEKPDKRAIGRRLQRARERLGLTQKQLAAAIGASLQTVQSYEAGRRTPSGGFATGYARLGVNLRWAMEDEGSMLLEGDHKQSQMDMLASAGGDDDASARMQRRVGRAIDGMKEAQRLVDDAAARCGYAIPQLVRQALMIAVMKGMAPDAVDLVMQMFKAQALLDEDDRKAR
jgi:transcriptional regulator with XRE-family HTH domain